MNSSHRLDLSALDVAPDDDLPEYEPQTAPRYEAEDYDAPLHIYHLKQTDRKLQHFVPHASSFAATYKVITNATLRVFSKKPDLEMVRTDNNPLLYRTASISFDNDGPLPWRPRAHFSHTSPNGNTNRYEMESRNFADWTLEIAGVTVAWRLEGRPVSLVLGEMNAGVVIARFTYSSCGTMATNGAAVGELTIYRDRLTADLEGIEAIMASLMVPIVHSKKMGKYYHNDEQARATSLTREQLPLQIAALVRYSTL